MKSNPNEKIIYNSNNRPFIRHSHLYILFPTLFRDWAKSNLLYFIEVGSIFSLFIISNLLTRVRGNEYFLYILMFHALFIAIELLYVFNSFIFSVYEGEDEKTSKGLYLMWFCITTAGSLWFFLITLQVTGFLG